MFSSLLLLSLATIFSGSGRANAAILKDTRITMSNVSIGKHFATFGFNNRGMAQLFVSSIKPVDAKFNLTIVVCTQSEMDILYSLSAKNMCYAQCNAFCKQ